ncbi:uncharacterized protein TA04095 [Theileria annulata]|uniref:MI domain-containing protein n=1 Tax=Theileria annulata TaxID=5874 RepID=Q4UC85_THEAN|nr:uncharacterized protein TA04095 [Theileria annulata]CAI75566.1 hypothetical protein TA04095 [Theileria annulata]|eukprot:XP_955042.1 hypothetical protein TA04095 [Theileria annulata]
MLPQVFYEYVTRNYNVVQLTLMQFNAFKRENEAQMASELMEVTNSAPKDEEYFSELLNIDPEQVNELAVYSISYDEEIKEYLKELLIYREICQEVIDVLYKNKDFEYILQFFEEIKQRYLTHEFLQLYIQRSIFRSIIYVMRVSRIMEKLMHIIPKSVMEMTFMRLLGSVPRSCAESEEAQDLFCIFLARSIVDGIVSASYIRKINRVQIGGILGVELIDKTIKWVKFNKNIYKAKEGSKLVVQFPMEILLMRRVKILGLITHLLRTGQASGFANRLQEIDNLNIDVVFTVRTLLRKFLTRENGLVSEVTEIIADLVEKKLMEGKLIGVMIKDIARVLHQGLKGNAPRIKVSFLFLHYTFSQTYYYLGTGLLFTAGSAVVYNGWDYYAPRQNNKIICLAHINTNLLAFLWLIQVLHY